MRQLIRLLSIILLAACGSVYSKGPQHPTLIKDGETIAFLGDSITAGGGSYGGYCRLVIHGLKTRGIHAKAIYAGVPGNKSSDMLLRLDSILRHKPEHLFLSVGVNDVWHTDETAKIGVFKPSPGMGCELEHFKIYGPQILDRCKAAGTKVIMSTFTQITENPEHRLNKKAQAYNAFLRGLAKERGLPIALLNEAAWDKINELKSRGNTDRNVISSDGIHPTAIGHRVMALGILKTMGLTDGELKALEKEWNECPHILTIGDRQVYSGSRDGGWRVMLLDCLNSGGDMVLDRTVVAKPATLGELLPKVSKAIDDRTKYLLLVPPMGELKKQTPQQEYETNLRSLVALAKEKNLQLVISTYAIVGYDSNSIANFTAAGYNDVLRKFCMKMNVPLVDIWQLSVKYLDAHPGAKVNFGDERFNHASGMLMAEAVFKAFGGNDAVLPELRGTWNDYGSYTLKYGNSVNIENHFSQEGVAALSEISDRFHKLEARKVLNRGVHELLYGDVTVNERRLSFTETNWQAKRIIENPVTLRVHPATENQRLAIQAHIKKAGIDLEAFYKQAFAIGMYVLRMEDPLRRGEY